LLQSLGMRTSLMFSILVAAATGACSQSLASHMSGTGGAGSGNGGQGGYDETVCNTLTAEYQSAVVAAETCQVGASGQCQQSVPSALSGCSCPTYITDNSTVYKIRGAWDDARCPVQMRACATSCPIAANTTCVSTDGGSTGVCSYVPGTGGGSGGAIGAGDAIGAGGSSLDAGYDVCGSLAAEYGLALLDAKSCMPNEGVECATPVPASLSPCGGCNDYVTSSIVLDGIRQKWLAAGCANVKVFCPKIACVQPRSAMCASTDAGVSVCTAVF
jgi:hypothetical protein